MNLQEFVQALMNGFIKCEVLHKVDSEGEWIAVDPLLKRGQFAISIISPTSTKFKVGDGARNYSSLPFAGDITGGGVTVRSASPGLNPGPATGTETRIYETSTAGVYVNFLDANGNPIVVAAGEYARFIEENNYFTKISIPSIADALVRAVWDLDFTKPAPRPASAPIVDKSTRPAGGFYAIAPPDLGDWYIDMNQPFEISQLKDVTVRSSVTGDMNVLICTVNESGALISTGEGGIVNTVAATPVTLDLSAKAANVLQAPGYYSKVGFLAVRNSTNNPIKLDGTVVGNQVWSFRGFAFTPIAHLPDTDINYQIGLYNELPLQAQVNKDMGVLPITKNAGTAAYKVKAEDHTVLMAAGGAGVSVTLRSFGVKVGKTYNIKLVSGTPPVTITAPDGAKIDGNASLQIVAVGASVRLQFDGTNYWVI